MFDTLSAKVRTMEKDFIESDNNTEDPVAEPRPVRSHRREDDRDRFFVLRNTLNILFMLGAVVGVAVYYKRSEQIGTYIILVSIVFKLVECCVRMLKRFL